MRAAVPARSFHDGHLHPYIAAILASISGFMMVNAGVTISAGGVGISQALCAWRRDHDTGRSFHGTTRCASARRPRERAWSTGRAAIGSCGFRSRDRRGARLDQLSIVGDRMVAPRVGLRSDRPPARGCGGPQSPSGGGPNGCALFSPKSDPNGFPRWIWSTRGPRSIAKIGGVSAKQRQTKTYNAGVAGSNPAPPTTKALVGRLDNGDLPPEFTR